MSNRPKNFFFDAFEKIKSTKHIEVIIAVIAVIVMIGIYLSGSCSFDENDGINAASDEYDYCSRTVADLEKKLSAIDGVGKVNVLINWSTSTEVVPAYTTSPSGSTSVVTEDGSIYVLKNVYPVPEGVIIICEGGGSISVKTKLISAVASYFGISENKITVLAMSK